MTQEDLLSTLRQLEPESEPDIQELTLQQLHFIANLLEDIKAKQDVNNECLLELIGLAKGMASSDFGSQVSPIRNKPAPRPIRRWSGNKSY
jgi:hypothetical protein